MLREILKVLACFNWITPAEIGLRRLFGGPARTFLVHERCGWSGGSIVQVLRENGVSSSGHMFVNDHHMFSVPSVQARYAQYLLDRAGVQVANRASGAPDRRLADPVTGAGQKDFLAELDRLGESVSRALRF